MKKTALACTLMITLLLAGPASAQDLSMLPTETTFVVEVDMASVRTLMSHFDTMDFASGMNDEAAEMVLNGIESIYVGLPNLDGGSEDSMYVFLRSNISLQQLIDIAVQHSDKPVDMQSKDIGGLLAFYNAADDNDEFHIAEAGPGLLVAGTAAGLQLYSDVRSGKHANAADNARLSELRSGIPQNSGIRVYGNTPKEASDVLETDAVAIGMSTDADALGMHLQFIAEDVNALDALEEQINNFGNMAGMFDDTGALTAVIQGMEISHTGQSLIVTMSVPFDTLKMLVSKAQSMGMQ